MNQNTLFIPPAQYAEPFTEVIPIHILPFEILARIFVHLAQDCGTISLPIGTLKRPLPSQVIVSHVCSVWRQVALGTREIWTDVKILPLLKYDSSKPQCKTWLSRAGQCLTTLTMNFNWGDHSRKIPASEFAIYVQSLVEPLFIRYLKLTISNVRLTQLSKLPRNTLSGLVELNLRITFDDDADLSDMPQFVDRTRTLTLFPTENTGRTIKALKLPWAQLRRLEIYLICLSDAVNILSLTPCLEVCSLDIRFADAGSGQVVLSHLEDLSLEVNKHIDRVIRSFILPNLTRLTLDYRDGWSTRTHEIIRQQYNLHRLQEIYFYCSKFKLTQHLIFTRLLLDHGPLLRVLCIEDNMVIDDETLANISTGALGCHLESLSVSCAMSRIEAMLSMVEARQKMAKGLVEPRHGALLTALKEVGLLVYTETDRAVMSQGYQESLDRLRQLGVEVKIYRC